MDGSTAYKLLSEICYSLVCRSDHFKLVMNPKKSALLKILGSTEKCQSGDFASMPNLQFASLSTRIASWRAVGLAGAELFLPLSKHQTSSVPTAGPVALEPSPSTLEGFIKDSACGKTLLLNQNRGLHPVSPLSCS